MPTRTVRPLDWFWIALIALAGTGMIVGSAWQLVMIANGSAPARVYGPEFNHGFVIFKSIFGIVLGLMNLVLSRIYYKQRSRSITQP